MPSKAHRKMRKHNALRVSTVKGKPKTTEQSQPAEQPKAREQQENKSILHRIWQFMDKSPILSAVIISLAAVLGTVLYKVYTYIYWLPYFKMLKVDTHYFENACFDKYELLVKNIPYFIITMVFYLIVDLLLKKVKNRAVKIGFCIGSVILSLCTMILAMFINVGLYNILWSVCVSLLFVSLKLASTKYLSMIGNRFLSFNMVVAWVLILVLFVGLMVYINGYNTNVVDVLVGDVRTIDDNKMVVFETDDQYYVIAFTQNEDGTIKLFRNSYAFADKEKQSVVKKHFNKIYNESDKSLDDVELEFLDIVW